jgi:hypothetical protein
MSYYRGEICRGRQKRVVTGQFYNGIDDEDNSLSKYSTLWIYVIRYGGI